MLFKPELKMQFVKNIQKKKFFNRNKNSNKTLCLLDIRKRSDNYALFRKLQENKNGHYLSFAQKVSYVK